MVQLFLQLWMLKVLHGCSEDRAPLHVGLRGFIFPLAEILKFVQKEDIIPTEVDRPVFKWAPAYVMVSVLHFLL
jgi:NADH-quinone oxidoreductase subunit H